MNHFKNQLFIDSLTHIVLGACLGEAIAGKKLGKRALFLGAFAQTIPDLDFFAALWTDTASNLLAHRGFTHSLLFAFVATFAFALAAEHFHRRHRVGFRTWLLFFGLEIGIHLFLDVFNAYGTGLFEPFSHARISFNVVFVADPFISIWPAMAFVALLILKRWDPRRRTWWRLGVFLPALYLVFCLFNKYQINRDSKMILLKQHIPFNRYFTTPTPLNNLLWYVVAGNDTGFYIGYRSVLDTRNRIDFQYYPRNDSLLDPLAGHEELQHLIRFSKGYYTVEKWNDTLVFNDLRFGQIVGWYDPRERFVFHYFLQHPRASNKMVVQRGRFAGWNAKTFRALLKRIRGN